MKKNKVRLCDMLADAPNWNSPASPGAPDWFEYRSGMSPISTLHPPSLKNPQDVKVPVAQDGWHKGDSKADREQAIRDLVTIHQRMRRQMGKPEVSQTALIPVHPGFSTP